MTKCLVTGGAGYFGELLTRKLLERGYSVRVLDLDPPADIYPGTEMVQADIRDADAVLSACEGIDVAFHNAAQGAMAKDKALLWSVNRDGTKNLLESCARRAVKKVVYTSSSAVYGVPRSNPVTEETLPSPVEEYGRAKLAGEELCREYAGKGLDVSIVRPCTILGHGRLGIFQILFEWIYQGKNIPVLNGGKNIYQFVHADDLAEACAFLLQQSAPPDLINIGTGTDVTIKELTELVAQVTGFKGVIKWDATKPDGTPRKLMDVSRLRALGWQARIALAEGVQKTYASFLAEQAAGTLRN